MNEQQPENQQEKSTDETRQLPPEAASAPTQEQPNQTSGGQRRLVRSRSDRMLLGVAGGLGRYFDVDPVIFRIGFGVSLFFGGLGVLAYLALALFVPDEQGGPPPVQRSRGLAIAVILVAVLVVAPIVGAGLFWTHGTWGALWLLLPIGLGAAVYAVLRDRSGPLTPGRVIGAIVLVFAAAAGLLLIALAGAFATATGSGVVIAAVVVVAGLVLVATAFAAGGARWLIAPALALAVGVGGAAAADLDFKGGIGERSYRPVAASSIPADGYRLGVGQLKVDLRGLDWRPNQVVHVKTDLGVGELVVGVPQKVCVSATAHAGAGEVNLTGERSDGADVNVDRESGSSATPRLVLDADVDIGELRVVNSDTADLNGRHFADESNTALRDAAQKACAR
jgi:phage shock protein PspC (stress-responsive transcriptional regulator)